LDTVNPFVEVLEEIRESGGDAFRLCFQCGKCDTVCPWNNFRNFSIRKLIREASFGLTEIESEDIWRCTTCGTCPDRCPRGVEQVSIGVSLRKIAANYDVVHASAKPAKLARTSLNDEGNPLNEERSTRAAWSEGLSVKPFAEGMEYLFFGCCYLSYDPRMKKVAAATARLLNEAGVEYGILGASESCCGESIRKTGAEETYRKLAKDNIKAFIDNGVKKIVVSSPHCLEAFKNEYAEFMVNFEVLHITELLAGLVREERLSINGEFARKVTWHDPCYLGRHNGIFDEPRELLGAVPGLELLEMAASRRNSLCCGGGGGRVWMETPKGERFSDLRVEQAKAIGAEVLATACPYCISMFEDSRLTLEAEDEIEIMDITEVLNEALE